MVLGLLSGAVSGIAGAAGSGAAPFSAPPTPDVTTVSPEVSATISAPFAVGRGARATALPVTGRPTDPLIGVGGGSSALVIAAVVFGVALIARRL